MINSLKCRKDSRGERCASMRTWLPSLASSTLRSSQLSECTCGRSSTRQTIQQTILTTYSQQFTRNWRTCSMSRVSPVMLKRYLKKVIPPRKDIVLEKTVRMKSLLSQSVRSPSSISYPRRLESLRCQTNTSILKRLQNRLNQGKWKQKTHWICLCRTRRVAWGRKKRKN